jgi:hypothetical protein
VSGAGNIAIGGTSATRIGIGYDGASVNTGTGTLMINGNVGIGTTSPGFPLEVAGAIVSDYGVSNGTGLLQLGNQFSNQNAKLVFSSTGDNSLNISTNYSLGTNNIITFSPGGAERVRFQQNGNVGIGTTGPAVALDVVGSENLTGTLGVYSGGSVKGQYYAYSQGSVLNYVGLLGFYSGGTEKVRIDTNGNVGIGVAGPNRSLEIGDSGTADKGIRLSYTGASGYYGELVRSYVGTGLGFRYNFNVVDGDIGYTGTALSIQPNGNVGIGTTNPGAKLQVIGSVMFPALANDSTGYYVCANTTTGNIATSTTACGASSIKYKENVKDITYGLAEVLKLRPVLFDYKSGYIPNASKQIGLIAEEVNLIIPELVAKDSKGEIQGLDYPKFVAVLIKAMQDLNTKIDDLTSNMNDIFDKYLASHDVYIKTVTVEDLNVKGNANMQGNINVEGKICVDGVCVTKDQLKVILQNAGGAVSSPDPVKASTGEQQTASSSPDSAPASTGEPGEVAGEATSTTTSETQPSQNTASTTAE